MANNSSRSAADVLDGLKARLGFGHKDDDDFYDDDYDDDYEDDGYDDDGYDDEPGGYRPLTTSSSHTSRFGRADSAASNLVSIDDVREHTRNAERAPRDAFDAGSSYTTYGNAPARSEGYDSLFEPTEAPTFTPYDPSAAYAAASSYTTRPLTVIKPVVYGDVERVARAVKSGDVVVLVMRNTPDDLSKRILDFSFGVASALDASVECPGDKVFAIARGAALTDDEKARLRNQGAL